MESDYRWLHSPGQPLMGRRTLDRESRMVVVAISFVTVDWRLEVNRVAPS